MKDIPVIRGRNYIASLVAEGEHVHQDFKFVISDARKIARSISAFANADGGRLLIGVKDNGTLAGVRNDEDIYVIEQAAERYCDPPQNVEFTAFRIDPATVVIRASIPQAASRPVRAQEPDGRWRAYYRVADENIAAHPLMERAWIERERGSLTLRLDGDASRLLALLAESAGGLEVRDVALGLAISERRAENMIVKLAAAGVIGFAYHAPRFMIVAGEGL
ncbi:MAG: ATP-binding protein [Bacteroidales bacterium]|nr:ATP-binding protein [Bacteroidales bacterium]